MYTNRQAIEVIQQSNEKQLEFLESTKDEKTYTVSRKTMEDNATAIDWLVKYIMTNCPPREKKKESFEDPSTIG